MFFTGKIRLLKGKAIYVELRTFFMGLCMESLLQYFYSCNVLQCTVKGEIVKKTETEKLREAI